jgi:hypothetical protein
LIPDVIALLGAYSPTVGLVGRYDSPTLSLLARYDPSMSLIGEATPLAT